MTDDKSSTGRSRVMIVGDRRSELLDMLTDAVFSGVGRESTLVLSDADLDHPTHAVLSGRYSSRAPNVETFLPRSMSPMPVAPTRRERRAVAAEQRRARRKGQR